MVIHFNSLVCILSEGFAVIVGSPDVKVVQLVEGRAS